MYSVSFASGYEIKSRKPTVDKKFVDETIIPLVLPVGRRGAGLFLVQVPLLLFPERTLPGSEMLLESLWEPPVPIPE